MVQQTKDILIQQFNLGGIASSIFDGPPNSVAKLTGFDPHSKPGVLRVAQKLTKDSGATVTEFCKTSLASSNGRTYWGSTSSGNIWERDANGNWTLATTIVPAAGSANILNMAEYQGVIYIATQSRLHKIVAADALGAAQWTANIVLNWKTFSIADPDFKPMVEQNLVLYIGDGKYITQVDAGVFSDAALDVADPLRIKSLGTIGTRVLAGTYTADTITKTQIIDWDTYSDSFRVSDPIDEVGIHAFLQADNFVYAVCGYSGNIYFYNGEQLELYRKIPGDYSPTKQVIVHPNAVANIEGQILFGVSNVTGDPCDQGVYRIGRYSSGYPYILDLPYPISERSSGEFVITGIEIGTVLVVGSDIFVAWKNGSAYGVDKLDYTTKLNGAYIETRVARPDRFALSNIPIIQVAYHLLPTSTGISIGYKANYPDTDTFTTPTEQIIDTDRNVVSIEPGFNATGIQTKVTVTTSVNDAPEIEAIAITPK